MLWERNRAKPSSYCGVQAPPAPPDSCASLGDCAAEGQATTTGNSKAVPPPSSLDSGPSGGVLYSALEDDTPQYKAQRDLGGDFKPLLCGPPLSQHFASMQNHHQSATALPRLRFLLTHWKSFTHLYPNVGLPQNSELRGALNAPAQGRWPNSPLVQRGEEAQCSCAVNVATQKLCPETRKAAEPSSMLRMPRQAGEDQRPAGSLSQASQYPKASVAWTSHEPQLCDLTYEPLPRPDLQ